MRHLQLALLASMCACATQAAESPPRADEPDVIRILTGQMKFLDASIAFCQEKAPELKRDLAAARAIAEAQIWKAERLIRAETDPKNKTLQGYLVQFAEGWGKYADQQMVAMKRQNASVACPTLVSSWTNTEADVVVEDWHNFVENQNRKAEAQ